MNKENFTLYVDSRFSSPFAMSVFVALKEKEIPFDIKKINLKSKEQHKNTYANLSLTRRIPTLVHNTFSLSESSAITEYLDELYQAPKCPSIYPKDIRQRAIARQIQAWLRSDFLPIRVERATEVIFFEPTDKKLSENARESVNKLFSAADKLLNNNYRNLFNEWCIADVDLTVMLNRLIINGDSVPEKLKAYASHQWLRPSVQSWVNLKRTF